MSLHHMLRAAVQQQAGDATDPYFNQVALLLHGDGTNGAQNNTFVDSSSNNFTITRTGNVAQGTFSPFSLAEGQWSNYFDGAGDYLYAPSSTAFDFGTGDWTVEGWQYFTGVPAPDSGGSRAHTMFSIASASVGTYGFGMFLNVDSTGQGTSFSIGKNTNTSQTITASVTTSMNTWYHFAVCKSGNNVYLFVNGTQVGTTTTSTTAWGNSTNIPKVGRLWDSNYMYEIVGYISNLRVIKGTAVYTSNFTPSTTPLTAISGTSLLTCQSNRFKDNSSNNFTITRNGDTKVTAFSPFAPSAAYSAGTNGGSGYFDGSGDQLSAGSSSSFAFGTGAYTVECWVYLNAAVSSSHMPILMANNTTGGFAFYNSYTTGYLQIVSNGGSVILGSSTLLTPSVWNHVVAVRSGTGTNQTSIFVNGVRVANGTDATNWTVTGPLLIGGISVNNYYTNGYTSNMRVVKGTAVYDPTSSTLTPPTAPLTAVANTQLLLNCTNAGIIDNSGKNDIETVGNAQISTSVKKYGTGSMAFDGTGDWLLLADRPELQLGTGNFTVEGWLYLGATGAARGIVGKGTSTTGWLLSTNSSNQVVFTYASSTITSTGTLVGSTWYHIAVCREGTGSNQTKIYINGTNDGTGTVNTNFNQTNVMYVGANRTGGDAMNGYIDDLRITKGQARYTANFTPPTQAFPNF